MLLGFTTHPEGAVFAAGVQFRAGGDGYSSRLRSGIRLRVRAVRVGDRPRSFLITMSSFIGNGVVGLLPLPVLPEQLAHFARRRPGIPSQCVATKGPKAFLRWSKPPRECIS